jgi:hypothetical protein
VYLCFRLIAVEFAGSHKRSMNRKPANMGIAGVEPRQLAPTVGTTGSGSTDSPAPSPTIANLTTSTRFDGSTSATAVDSASLFDIDTNAKIDIDTAVGIAVLTVINTDAKIDIDIAIDTAVGRPPLTPTHQKLRSTSLDRPSSTLHRQTPPILFRPRSSSTLPQARQEQFRR